ncbi:hypothetical protein Avbf_18425 [Armadillidium vulgare]|nr:hypothetical protein Avbf_18425 [Armadillidium vulgare]
MATIQNLQKIEVAVTGSANSLFLTLALKQINLTGIWLLQDVKGVVTKVLERMIMDDSEKIYKLKVQHTHNTNQLNHLSLFADRH